MNPYLPDLRFVFRYALLCHRTRNTSTTTIYTTLHSIPQSMQLKQTNKQTINRWFDNYEAYSVMHLDMRDIVPTQKKTLNCLDSVFTRFCHACEVLILQDEILIRNPGHTRDYSDYCNRSKQGDKTVLGIIPKVQQSKGQEKKQ